MNEEFIRNIIQQKNNLDELNERLKNYPQKYLSSKRRSFVFAGKDKLEPLGSGHAIEDYVKFDKTEETEDFYELLRLKSARDSMFDDLTEKDRDLVKTVFPEPVEMLDVLDVRKKKNITEEEALDKLANYYNKKKKVKGLKPSELDGGSFVFTEATEAIHIALNALEKGVAKGGDNITSDIYNEKLRQFIFDINYVSSEIKLAKSDNNWSMIKSHNAGTMIITPDGELVEAEKKYDYSNNAIDKTQFSNIPFKNPVCDIDETWNNVNVPVYNEEKEEFEMKLVKEIADEKIYDISDLKDGLVKSFIVSGLTDRDIDKGHLYTAERNFISSLIVDDLNGTSNNLFLVDKDLVNMNFKDRFKYDDTKPLFAVRPYKFVDDPRQDLIITNNFEQIFFSSAAGDTARSFMRNKDKFDDDLIYELGECDQDIIDKVAYELVNPKSDELCENKSKKRNRPKM